MHKDRFMVLAMWDQHIVQESEMIAQLDDDPVVRRLVQILGIPVPRRRLATNSAGKFSL